jgi:hypothetical protein
MKADVSFAKKHSETTVVINILAVRQYKIFKSKANKLPHKHKHTFDINL